MLTERCELTVRVGAGSDFLEAFRHDAAPILRGVPGVISVHFGMGVENPDRLLLLVHWETLDAHGAFAGTEAQTSFRAVLTPFTIGGSMEHFVLGE